MPNNLTFKSGCTPIPFFSQSLTPNNARYKDQSRRREYCLEDTCRKRNAKNTKYSTFYLSLVYSSFRISKLTIILRSWNCICTQMYLQKEIKKSRKSWSYSVHRPSGKNLHSLKENRRRKENSRKKTENLKDILLC